MNVTNTNQSLVKSELRDYFIRLTILCYQLHYKTSIRFIETALYCPILMVPISCFFSSADIMEIPDNIRFCKALVVIDFSGNPLSR